MEFQLEWDLFVSFQKLEFFLYEKARYLKLAKSCKKVFIFAQNIDNSHTAEFSNTIFIEIVSHSPIANEWLFSSIKKQECVSYEKL